MKTLLQERKADEHRTAIQLQTSKVNKLKKDKDLIREEISQARADNVLLEKGLSKEQTLQWDEECLQKENTIYCQLLELQKERKMKILKVVGEQARNMGPQLLKCEAVFFIHHKYFIKVLFSGHFFPRC
jgi:hypothetical protein